jgi:hypothetical protein
MKGNTNETIQRVRDALKEGLITGKDADRLIRRIERRH